MREKSNLDYLLDIVFTTYYVNEFTVLFIFLNVNLNNSSIYRTEGSLVILEVPKNDVDKKSRTSSNSSSNHSLLTSSFVAPVEPRPTTNGHTHFSQLLYSSQDDDSTSL